MATQQLQAVSAPAVEKAPNLYQKLHAVMEECEYIQKDKENTNQHYWYASEAAIKAKLHKSLTENRVLFVPIGADEISRAQCLGKDGAQTAQAITTVRLKYRFIDIDNPADFVEGACYGSGSDNMDKGLYKAITGAIKYIMTSTFLIETGDDPENEMVTPSKEDAKAAQNAYLKTQGIDPAAPRKVEKQEYGVNVPNAVKLIWQTFGENREHMLNAITEMYYTLSDAIGQDAAKVFSDELKKQFKVKSSSDFTLNNGREAVLLMWQKIEDAKVRK